MFHSDNYTEEGDTKNNSLIKTDEIQSFSYCLGEVLRDIRKQKINATQGELGLRLGLTQKAISDAESGRTVASVYLFCKYCEEANIEPHDAIRKLDEAWKDRKF